MSSRLPDFLIIGAGKSGTTSLDRYLDTHPDIYMSPIKEPNFFSYLDIDPSGYKNDPQTYAHCLNSIRDWEEYKNLFSGSRESQILGETSNTYLSINGTARKIKQYLPNVKLIVILRQPAERLYSRFLHLQRDGNLQGLGFQEALNKNSLWWDRSDLIKEGYYFSNLVEYYKLFDANRIKVVLFEDFISQKGKVMQDIFSFLGVSSSWQVKKSVRYNVSGKIKNQYIDMVFGRKSKIIGSLKSIISNELYNKLKNQTLLRDVLTTIREKNMVKEEMGSDLKEILTEELYQDDIKNLARLIGRDLSHWV